MITSHLGVCTLALGTVLWACRPGAVAAGSLTEAGQSDGKSEPGFVCGSVSYRGAPYPEAWVELVPSHIDPATVRLCPGGEQPALLDVHRSRSQNREAGQVGRADAKGTYRLPVPAAGRYWLRVLAPGRRWRTCLGPFRFDPSGSYEIPIELERPGAVEGTVLFGYEAPVEGRMLQFSKGWENHYVGMTDAGTFEIEDLSPGAWTVSIVEYAWGWRGWNRLGGGSARVGSNVASEIDTNVLGPRPSPQFGSALSVTVEAGKRVRRDLDFRRTEWFSLNGRIEVRGLENQPTGWEKAWWASLLADGTTRTPIAETEIRDGRFSLSSRESGDHWLRVSLFPGEDAPEVTLFQRVHLGAEPTEWEVCLETASVAVSLDPLVRTTPRQRIYFLWTASEEQFAFVELRPWKQTFTVPAGRFEVLTAKRAGPLQSRGCWEVAPGEEAQVYLVP